MAISGAEVFLTSIGPRDSRFPLAKYKGLRLVEIDGAFDVASESDLIVANTALAKSWVVKLAVLDSNAVRRVIWWIHEIDLQLYAAGMECLNRVAAAVFDSECSFRRWQETGLTMPPRVKVIHPGVTDSFLNAATRLRKEKRRAAILRPFSNPSRLNARERIRMELGVARQDFLITLIGSYGPLKGHDLLVETVGQMLQSSPNLPLKLLLVGFEDDTQRETFLKKLSASEFAAVGPNRVINRVADPKPYYLASDAYVMNTQSPGEPFGLVSTEAMAFGLPVLGTDDGGTREIVLDGTTGLLHPLGREGQLRLSENILSLLNDRRRATILGNAGFKRVKTHFRANQSQRELAELMSQVIDHTPI